MRRFNFLAVAAFFLSAATHHSFAASALSALGKDYAFPNKIDGLPAKLSDFGDLQINSFQTSDGVKLTYWEAGTGKPLVFLPGWSSNGAEYINVLYLLRHDYHVYVLDPRNQGLSQRVDYGNRIARFATDLKELLDQIGIDSADFCGHSMGSAVLWSYIDMYGTKRIHKVAFVDEPISISARADWSEQQRRDFGAIVSSPEELVKAMTRFMQPPDPNITNKSAPILVFLGKDTPAFLNSQGFAGAFIQNDPKYLLNVLFDHAANDWHDVITHRINVPTAIFTGELSNNLASQRWMHTAIPHSKLMIYSKDDQGDHLLMFRSPIKFTRDLRAFLEAKEMSMDKKTIGVSTHVLLQSTSSWNGAPYTGYPQGQPELTVLKITIPANAELPWHKHPMPNAAYVLSGEITISGQDGSARHFFAGQVIAETVDTFHRGVVGDKDAEFIVFYPSIVGMPLSVPKP